MANVKVGGMRIVGGRCSWLTNCFHIETISMGKFHKPLSGSPSKPIFDAHFARPVSSSSMGAKNLPFSARFTHYPAVHIHSSPHPLPKFFAWFPALSTKFKIYQNFTSFCSFLLFSCPDSSIGDLVRPLIGPSVQHH